MSLREDIEKRRASRSAIELLLRDRAARFSAELSEAVEAWGKGWEGDRALARELAQALDGIVHHPPEEVYRDDPNAPGHAHRRPGIWDPDNTEELRNKPCAWCAAWNKGKALAAKARAAGLLKEGT